MGCGQEFGGTRRVDAGESAGDSRVSSSCSATLAGRLERRAFLARLKFGREFCEDGNVETFLVPRAIGTVAAEMPLVVTSSASIFQSNQM
jgi:hypothetical protein